VCVCVCVCASVCVCVCVCVWTEANPIANSVEQNIIEQQTFHQPMNIRVFLHYVRPIYLPYFETGNVVRSL